MRVEDLETPALLLDVNVSRANLARMAGLFAGSRARLRPHFKNHKTPALARLQLEAGQASGMTCAKLGEAEALVEAGFDDVLIANQVVGATKARRLAALARRAVVCAAVDDMGNAAELSQAARDAGVGLDVLIEVNVGQNRCGVRTPEAAAALAREVSRLPGLRLRGLQGYEGHATYIDDPAARAVAVRQAGAALLAYKQAVEHAGIEVGRLCGGSASSARQLASEGPWDEVQAGTYATMDWRYAELIPDFGVALSVLARVVSVSAGLAVVDVGTKGLGLEFGPARVADWPGAECRLHEEHTLITGGPAARVGDRVRLVPSHACTTCNLHRTMHAIDAGRVAEKWPISASGALT